MIGAAGWRWSVLLAATAAVAVRGQPIAIVSALTVSEDNSATPLAGPHPGYVVVSDFLSLNDNGACGAAGSCVYRTAGCTPGGSVDVTACFFEMRSAGDPRYLPPSAGVFFQAGGEPELFNFRQGACPACTPCPATGCTACTATTPCVADIRFKLAADVNTAGTWNGATGPLAFDLSLRDTTGAGTTASLQLTVTAVNDLPLFTFAPSAYSPVYTTPEQPSSPTGPVSPVSVPMFVFFRPGPATATDEAAGTPPAQLVKVTSCIAAPAGLIATGPTLVVTAVTPYPGMLPGELQFTLASKAAGVATMSCEFDDGVSAPVTAAAMFTIRITEVNDPPSAAFGAAGTALTFPEDNGLAIAADVVVPVFVKDIRPGPPSESGQSVSFACAATVLGTGTPSPLILTPVIRPPPPLPSTISAPWPATAELAFTTVLNQVGTAEVRCTATDSCTPPCTCPTCPASGFAPSSFQLPPFTITLTEVNDPPEVTGPHFTTIYGSSGASTAVERMVTDIRPGPQSATSEKGQTVIFTCTASDPGLFSGGPAIDSSGTLTFTVVSRHSSPRQSTYVTCTVEDSFTPPAMRIAGPVSFTIQILTATLTLSPTLSSSPTDSATLSLSLSPSLTMTRTSSRTASATYSVSSTVSVTPTATLTLSDEGSVTRLATPTATSTATGTPTPTATRSLVTNTVTPTLTSSVSPSPSPSPTVSWSASLTRSMSASWTATPSYSSAMTATPTTSFTQSPSATSSPHRRTSETTPTPTVECPDQISPPLPCPGTTPSLFEPVVGATQEFRVPASSCIVLRYRVPANHAVDLRAVQSHDVWGVIVGRSYTSGMCYTSQDDPRCEGCAEQLIPGDEGHRMAQKSGIEVPSTAVCSPTDGFIYITALGGEQDGILRVTAATRVTPAPCSSPPQPCTGVDVQCHHPKRPVGVRGVTPCGCRCRNPHVGQQSCVCIVDAIQLKGTCAVPYPDRCACQQCVEGYVPCGSPTGERCCVAARCGEVPAGSEVCGKNMLLRDGRCQCRDAGLFTCTRGRCLPVVCTADVIPNCQEYRPRVNVSGPCSCQRCSTGFSIWSLPLTPGAQCEPTQSPTPAPTTPAPTPTCPLYCQPECTDCDAKCPVACRPACRPECIATSPPITCVAACMPDCLPDCIAQWSRTPIPTEAPPFTNYPVLTMLLRLSWQQFNESRFVAALVDIIGWQIQASNINILVKKDLWHNTPFRSGRSLLQAITPVPTDVDRPLTEVSLNFVSASQPQKDVWSEQVQTSKPRLIAHPDVQLWDLRVISGHLSPAPTTLRDVGDSDDDGFEWWMWLLIGLAVLFLLCCLLFLLLWCRRRKRKKKRKDVESQEKELESYGNDASDYQLAKGSWGHSTVPATPPTPKGSMKGLSRSMSSDPVNPIESVFGQRIGSAPRCTVLATGRGEEGQLGGDVFESRTQLQPIDRLASMDVTAVACGAFHSIVIADGFVYVFGEGKDGQLGTGGRDNTAVPIRLHFFDDKGPRAVGAGEQHSMVLCDAGLFTFGRGGDGQLGVGERTDSLLPVPVPFQHPIDSINSGCHHNVLLTETGDVFSFGWNAYGQLGVGDTTDRLAPEAVQGMGKVRIVACGVQHTVCLSHSGEVFVFGQGDYGQLGLGPGTVLSLSPSPLDFFSGRKVQAIGCWYHTLILADGLVYGFGEGIGRKNGGASSTFYPEEVEELEGAERVWAGSEHSVVLTRESLLAWGKGEEGKLGLGSNDDVLHPTVVMRRRPGQLLQAALGTSHTLVRVEG